jgi:hypothetical protein
MLPLELPLCNQLKTNQFAFAKRRAGSLLKCRKLWPLTAVYGCSGHKMATVLEETNWLRDPETEMR